MACRDEFFVMILLSTRFWSTSPSKGKRYKQMIEHFNIGWQKLGSPTDYEHHKCTIKICYNQYYSKCILNHTQLSSAKTSRKEKEKTPRNVCCVNYLCTTKQHKEWINVLTRLLMDLLVLASLIATRTILTIVHASNDSELDARMLVDKSQLLILSSTHFCLLLLLLLSLYCCQLMLSPLLTSKVVIVDFPS